MYKIMLANIKYDVVNVYVTFVVKRMLRKC